jgi:L-ascorbate metabolism protein UlaG (beta-lactamase superfamily)
LLTYTRKGKRFLIERHHGGAGFLALMKWQFTEQKAKWPRRVENAVHLPPPARVYGNELKATWIGHSTVLLQTAGINILTDPFRASPLTLVGPKRVRPPALAPRHLPPIDYVLISHNHYDHLDMPGLAALLKNHNPQFLTALGNRKLIGKLRNGLDIHELDWRASHDALAIKFTAMPAFHWSKRSFGDANHALWCAFAIETPGGVIYFAGDTGYGDGRTFREIRERFGAPRLSLLPIGAYEPRWFMKPHHMNPEDAVRAHIDLASRTSLAIHHGTIQLTNEAIDQPARDLEKALKKHSTAPDTFLAPDAGETVEIL